MILRHTPPPLGVKSLETLYRDLRETEDEIEARGDRPGLKTYHASRLHEMKAEDAPDAFDTDEDAAAADAAKPALKLIDDSQ